MTPATVTDSLLHDLVTSSRAEGTGQLAVAAAITLDDRILLCGRTTQDFDQEWDLPGGPALPGETLTSALDRTLASGYGLGTVEIPRYLGSHDRIHAGAAIRTFVFAATCADPLRICQHAQVAHLWADFASLPDQVSQDLARLADLAMQATTGWSEAPSRQWQITTALRACSKGMYCDEAATELIISHRSWLLRDDFTRQFILTRTEPAGGITAVIDWERHSPPSRPATCPAQAAKPPSST